MRRTGSAALFLTAVGGILAPEPLPAPNVDDLSGLSIEEGQRNVRSLYAAARLRF